MISFKYEYAKSMLSFGQSASKLHILTILNANDVNFIPIDRQNLDL